MTLSRILRWIIGIPLAVLAIGFAVANRQWVTISLDPFSRESPLAAIDLPLWTIFFVGAFFGLLAGWVAAWVAQGKWRRATRQARIELLRSQNEMRRLASEREFREPASGGSTRP
jgi:hypothetical protein